MHSLHIITIIATIFTISIFFQSLSLLLLLLSFIFNLIYLLIKHYLKRNNITIVYFFYFFFQMYQPYVSLVVKKNLPFSILEQEKKDKINNPYCLFSFSFFPFLWRIRERKTERRKRKNEYPRFCSYFFFLLLFSVFVFFLSFFHITISESGNWFVFFFCFAYMSTYVSILLIYITFLIYQLSSNHEMVVTPCTD